MHIIKLLFFLLSSVVQAHNLLIIQNEKYINVRKIEENDALSRNISIILENLLKSYEISHLPTHGKGIPTVVKTNILIRSMGPVSELNMDYSMDCYFRQYWRDERLSFNGPIKSLSLNIKMLDKIWRPDTYFHNGKHSHIHMMTVPNKLLRLGKNGDILYSMRLTIKATCPMELRSFPMDKQSCPLIIGSYAHTAADIVYKWQNKNAVTFVSGMTLNQFDLISMPHRNLTFNRREGDFSVLQVSFNLRRHTGYFIIQVYVPCILIVVLSWVSFWIQREATSDRVGLCITTVLTLSTISLDSRIDLPKVKYATALDWFLLMSFFYCIATLLEFAGVHYFTKVGSGETVIEKQFYDSLKAFNESSEVLTGNNNLSSFTSDIAEADLHTSKDNFQKNLTYKAKWKQIYLCLIGNDKFRRMREAEAISCDQEHFNSVSQIDKFARTVFPISFGLLNILYWILYGTYEEEFSRNIFRS